MDKPLLSIAVPTKNRYYYLKYLIKLVASFGSDEIELVVQDNSDDNTEIKEFLEKNPYDFVRYYHNYGIISMTGNCDLAIGNCHGKYICMIGDDDGVTRYILDCVKWMEENSFTILKSSYSIYKWPSFKSSRYFNVSATALCSNYTMKYELRNCKSALGKLLKSGISTLEYMPKLYNGIVRRDVLDRVYAKCGSYSPGPSPDMANAVSIALEEENYVFIDAPIIIGGQSAHLGGDANKYKNKICRLEDQKIIDPKDVEAWDARIPKIWAAMAVWPASALSALKKYNATDYINKTDFEKVYKVFIYEHPTVKNLAYELSSNKIRLKINGVFYKIYRFLKGFVSVLNYKLFNVMGGLKINYGVQDIIEAEAIFVKGIKDFNPQK